MKKVSKYMSGHVMFHALNPNEHSTKIQRTICLLTFNRKLSMESSQIKRMIDVRKYCSMCLFVNPMICWNSKYQVIPNLLMMICGSCIFAIGVYCTYMGYLSCVNTINVTCIYAQFDNTSTWMRNIRHTSIHTVRTAPSACRRALSPC